MEATLKTIETKVKLLGDDNLDTENRKTIASIIHTDIDKMINLFDLQVSLFKKYPLMGAPPLIQLASLIAMFSPIAKTLIPIEAVNPDSSCKMRDILIDYRPRIVNARLRELHSKVSSFGSRLKVLALLYNPNGYNQTSPGEIDCKKGCELDHAPNEYCLEDKFSNNSFECTIKGGKSVCVEDYGKLIRHRVEKLFPVDLLDKLCSDRKPKIPTGNIESRTLNECHLNCPFMRKCRLWMVHTGGGKSILVWRTVPVGSQYWIQLDCQLQPSHQIICWQ